MSKGKEQYHMQETRGDSMDGICWHCLHSQESHNGNTDGLRFFIGAMYIHCTEEDRDDVDNICGCDQYEEWHVEEEEVKDGHSR